jgi:hypothetical protein
MIDHDHIDDLRTRSEAERDARRYRRHATGVVYRVRSQARGPSEPCVLEPVDLGGPTLHVTPGDLARDFTRCDAGVSLVGAPLVIPTPAELRARQGADVAQATDALARRVADVITNQWSESSPRVKVDLGDEPARAVEAVVKLFATHGWEVIELRAPRALSIMPATP